MSPASAAVRRKNHRGGDPSKYAYPIEMPMHPVVYHPTAAAYVRGTQIAPRRARHTCHSPPPKERPDNDSATPPHLATPPPCTLVSSHDPEIEIMCSLPFATPPTRSASRQWAGAAPPRGVPGKPGFPGGGRGTRKTGGDYSPIHLYTSPTPLSY